MNLAKPCAHCGGTDIGRQDADGLQVRLWCRDCNDFGPPGTTIVEAIMQWNKRADDQPRTVMTLDGPAHVI